tara:strand:- start:976 stop:1905 length:930 start_codon:yes stop_codon:yes gene_type:complete
MFKIIFTIITLINFSLSAVIAENKYEIMFNIDKKIISNFDIQKESNYLLAINPSLNISTKQLKEISTEALIRETIKENEILKYYQLNYDDPQLLEFTKNIYSRLDIKDENEFNTYLLKFNLSVKEITKKIAIEKGWNKLVYERYKDLISVDELKMKDILVKDLKKSKTQTSYLISEILFDSKNEIEFQKLHNKIINTIKEKKFESAASIYSISDSSINGGQIGWVNKNEVSSIIYKELNKLSIGAFTKPIKVASGFLIIYLNDLKKVKQENNLEEELKKVIVAEKNRQLNEYSIIYYKKVKKQVFINEK